MKTIVIALAAAAALTAPATADTLSGSTVAAKTSYSRGYLAAGAGGGVDTISRMGLHVEGGVQLGHPRLVARGQIGVGIDPSRLIDTDTYTQVRAGLEARHCERGTTIACLLVGADVAYTRDVDRSYGFRPNETTVQYRPSAVPRIGAEVGDRIRVRALIEIPVYREPTMDGPLTVGLAATLAAGYGF